MLALLKDFECNAIDWDEVADPLTLCLSDVHAHSPACKNTRFLDLRFHGFATTRATHPIHAQCCSKQVSAAFREEWAASKSKLKGSKYVAYQKTIAAEHHFQVLSLTQLAHTRRQKKIQLSKAEELALAATTQVTRPVHV